MVDSDGVVKVVDTYYMVAGNNKYPYTIIQSSMDLISWKYER